MVMVASCSRGVKEEDYFLQNDGFTNSSHRLVGMCGRQGCGQQGKTSRSANAAILAERV